MAAVGTAEIGIAAADAAHVPWSGVEADAMPTPGALLEAALLRYLQRHRRRVTSKGLLLQALPAEERVLDQALTALIAAGQVAEHAHRTGVGYAPAPQDGSREEGSNFQLSLFGQSEGTSTDETALADPAPVTDTVCLPLPQGDDLSW